MACKIDLKAVLLGQVNVGKSAVRYRFVHDCFQTPGYTTIGASFDQKTIEVNGESVVVGLWDTCGNDKLDVLNKLYCKAAHAGIICYDITDCSSWERAKSLVMELKSDEPKCRIYLCGTKLDLVLEDRGRREVTIQNVVDFTDEIHAKFFETSSKTGENVDELFFSIMKHFVNDRSAKTSTDSSKEIDLEFKKAKRDGCRTS